MSRRVRSVVLFGVATLMLLAGYLLQKLENGDATPEIPTTDATPTATILDPIRTAPPNPPVRG